MERWVGRVALVTGASAGIGAAIAESLVRHGMVVVGTGRNTQPIKDLAGRLKDAKGKLHVIQCDVSKEEEILAMFDQIRKEHKGVDVCINNAGLGHAAPLLSGQTAQWRDMLEVNVLALAICTREAVKSMRERNVDDGHIVHINSTSGHKVVTRAAGHFYSVSKHAVTALTEGHRNELREMKSHIRVSAISPGIVATQFAPRMIGPDAAKTMYGSLETLKPEDVAESVTYVLSAPPHVQVHDILMRPTEQQT